MKTKLSLFCLFLPLIYLLIGCTSESNADNLVGTEACRPPCWMDIQPGITKFDEMVSLLSEQEKRSEGTISHLETGIKGWRSANNINIYFYEAKNGLVSKIELDLRSNSLSLSDIIDKFGEPSKLDIGKIRDGFLNVDLFYPERGLGFVGTSNQIDISNEKIGLNIKPEMIITKGVFFPPSDISTMVTLLYGVKAVPKALSDIQEWIGYGIYYE